MVLLFQLNSIHSKALSRIPKFWRNATQRPPGALYRRPCLMAFMTRDSIVSLLKNPRYNCFTFHSVFVMGSDYAARLSRSSKNRRAKRQHFLSGSTRTPSIAYQPASSPPLQPWGFLVASHSLDHCQAPSHIPRHPQAPPPPNASPSRPRVNPFPNMPSPLASRGDAGL